MKKTENVKGHGFLRKTKAFGLASGIALGATLLIGANTVSADEATATTPSTTATTNESKTVVIDEGLTEVANKAKEAGATVNAEPTKNIGTAKTEEEATKLDEQAKKEVADQKAEIEKKTADYTKEVKESENNRKTLIANLSENTGLYNTTASQLRALADKDFDAGKASFGEFKSSNGTVRFLDAPNRVETNKIDPTVALLNSNVINNPKEIVTYYSDAPMLADRSFVSDKRNVKVVPILVNDGETITYKVNYAPDSNLGQLGVGYVEKSYTLKGSPVQSGKIALLADRYGTIVENYVYGGLGRAYDVIKTGEWGYASSWTYYDKDGKKIDSKELTSRFVNKYWYPNVGLSANDIKLTPTTENKSLILNVGTKEYTKDISNPYVNGGDSFFTATRMYEELAREQNVIDPAVQKMSMSGAEVKPVIDTIVKTPTVPTINYHLVSYTVDKPDATNPSKDAKGLVEVHYVVDNAERTVLKDPVIQTPESPIGTKYDTTSIKLPTITKDGKTYEVVRSEGTEKGQVVKGKTVVTYLYKLKEEPKPTPTPEVKKGSIVQKFVDESGKEIAKSTNTGEKPVDEAVKLSHPNEITFEGKTYTFTKQDKVDPAKIPNGTETITYVYKLKEEPKPTPTPTPVVNPTTIHIDGDTRKEIAPPEKGTKPFKNIDGFEPSPKDPKNVENPNGETIRVYNRIKKGSVEVRYVKDDASKTVLKDPVADTVDSKVGSDYDTTDNKPVTITKDGVTYELVRTEGVEKGKVVEGKTVVTYVYREVQKPITIHIDTEGNPVAPKEDGTKPFKEIEGYKPAPSDSKNVEDPKGVTIRVYDKVKPEAPQEAPKTPEKPQPQQPATQAVATNQLPHTGSEAGTALAIAGLGLLGLGVLAYKKKEN